MKTLNFTGLNENSVQKVNNALAQLLADFQIHYANLRNLHWNIKGRGFFILHEKYEELYNSVATKIDEVAERILQLDGTPEHRFSEYLKKAKVQELAVISNNDEGLKYILDTTKTLIAEERNVLAIATEAGDDVTVGLITDYLAGQEKLVWMLAAYNTEA